MRARSIDTGVTARGRIPAGPYLAQGRGGPEACNPHRSAVTQRLSATVELLPTMALADRPTTITIRSSTRELLESLKRPGETYDGLLQELAEEYYSPRLLAELKKRVADVRGKRMKGIPAEEMRRRLGL